MAEYDTNEAKMSGLTLDPGNLQWNQTEIPSMSTERNWPATVILNNNRFAVIGGAPSSSACTPSNTIEVWDGEAKEWDRKWPHLNQARHAHAAVISNGKLIVAGGHSGAYDLDSIECFEDNRWRTLRGRLTTGIRGCAMAAVGDLVYIIGGYSNGKRLSTVQILDIRTERVSKGPEMTTARFFGAAAVVNNCIWMVGGEDLRGNKLATAEYLRLDDLKASWTPASMTLTDGRYQHAVVAVQQCLVVLGGERLSSVEVLDTKRQTRWSLPNMNSLRSGCSALTLPNGQIVVVGGSGLLSVETLRMTPAMSVLLNSTRQVYEQWPDTKSSQQATNCNTRIELDHAIANLENKMEQLNGTIDTLSLKQFLEYEEERNRLKAFAPKMPSSQDIQKIIAELEVHIRNTSIATKDRILLAEERDKIMPRLKLEQEAAAKLGDLQVLPETSTIPSTPSAPTADCVSSRTARIDRRGGPGYPNLIKAIVGTESDAIPIAVAVPDDGSDLKLKKKRGWFGKRT